MPRPISLKLIASLLPVAMAMVSPFASGQVAAPAPAPASKPASTPVPVREVVLFSSGVGYFEHFGTVHGDVATELRFKKEQINDILKSLLLQDLDGGKVTSVTYGSQGPLSHTLKSFQVDISSNPPLSDLLNQLRGSKVTVTTKEGATAGTVLGVEKKQRNLGDKDHPQVIDVWTLNLWTGGNIRPVDLDQVTDLKLDDLQLQEELNKALVALAQARDQDTKPVQIHFQGPADHRVRIGYVVEAPVWKTSYRLVLPPQGGVEKPKDPADEKKEPAATQPAAGPEGHLQGWAIVENQTDSDWNNIELSLVSGRPLSFIENLYQPLYVPRPVVQPQLYASLQPQTYGAGMELQSQQMEQFGRRDSEKRAQAMERNRGLNMAKAAAAPAPMAAGIAGDKDEDAKQAIDALASVASIASAAKVGELFEYTVGSVSLPRQSSAMIPIITDAISTLPLSIYNASVLARNPLLGARLNNTTGKLLPAGPLTVLAENSYAGDASIEDLPAGQNRLISYGIDQQVLVDSTHNTNSSSLLTGRIIKGVLELTIKQVFSQDYVAENKAEHARTLLIEHPFRPGWKLTAPAKADETTESLYRFQGTVGAGKSSKLTVQEELTQNQQMAILPMDVGQVLQYSKTGEIPKPVRDALEKAVSLKNDLTDTQRQIAEHQQKLSEITQEQTRIRDNLKTVPQNTDYYQRLLKKLDEQETAIEKLQGEVKTLQQKQTTQQQALESYLQNLDV